MRRRSLLLAPALCSILIAAACGGSSSPTSPTPTPAPAPAASKAELTVSIAPSPVTASVCNPKCAGTNGAQFDFAVSMTIVVRETAGLGGNIDSIDLFSARNGAVYSTLNLNPSQIAQFAGTNHVAASGSLSVPLSLLYSTPDGGKERTTAVFVRFTDDKGNAFTQSVTVNVL